MPSRNCESMRDTIRITMHSRPHRGLLSRLPDSGGFNNWVEPYLSANSGNSPLTRGQTESIPLVNPGSAFLPQRWTQLDLRVAKKFPLPGRGTWQLQLDCFNALNSHTILSEATSTNGTVATKTTTEHHATKVRHHPKRTAKASKATNSTARSASRTAAAPTASASATGSAQPPTSVASTSSWRDKATTPSASLKAWASPQRWRVCR